MSASLFEFVARWLLYILYMRMIIILPLFQGAATTVSVMSSQCGFFEILVGLCLFLQSRREASSAAGTFVHNVSFTANKLAELQLKRAAGINNIATAF